MSALPPVEFGRFHLLERIGAGGMGEVFRAEMRGPDGFSRIVVVKRMLPDLASEPDAVEMFVHEAKLAGRLIHPNIVQVYDFGKIGSRYFLVMEFVAGCDLHRLLRFERDHQRKLPPSVAVTITAALLEGLAFAHALRGADGAPLGLVHRDVAPSNVLLGSAGEIKLSDFGIAKTRERLEHTRAGAVKGKYLYMSPEQVRASPSLDARSDLFAVGVMLYEMVTGARPFTAKTGPEVMDRITRGQYERPENLGAGLLGVVESALQTRADDRFQSARGFREVLLSRAARDGVAPDPELLRSLVAAVASEDAAEEQATRRERPAAGRQPTEELDNASTQPAEVAMPTPAAVVSLPPAPTANTLSVVIRPKHIAFGGIVLVGLIALTFVIAARFGGKGESRTPVVRVALRMYPAQAQWFVEHVFQPFAQEHDCKVEVVEFNSTEELTRILANGEADVAKVDVEHAPVLVELGQLQRIPALGERVDAAAYKELLAALRPEALRLGRFHTTIGDDLYLLPRKLETAQLVYRPSLVKLAVSEMPKQQQALDARLRAIVGHGLPEGFALDGDPAGWTTWDVVAAAWVWAHTPIDGRTEPRYAVRQEKRALMEAVSGGAPEAEPWHVSPAMIDVFYGYAVLRELDVLRAESFRAPDFAKLRELLANRGLAAFVEVQIDVGILVGNGHGLPQLIDDPSDWNVAPLPRLIGLEHADAVAAQESRSEVWGWGWGVPRNSREPELAMRLIMSILSHDRHAAELEEFPILRVRGDVAPAWSVARRVNQVGDTQLANGRARFVDWPKRAGELEQIELRIERAFRDIVIERHYGSDGHPVDRAVIEARLHKFLDAD